MIACPARSRPGRSRQIKHDVGQTRTSPIPRRVIPGLVCIISYSAVSGDLGIYQAGVEMFDVFIANLKPLGKIRRVIGYKYVCSCNKLAQDLATAFGLQINREALLVSGVE